MKKNNLFLRNEVIKHEKSGEISYRTFNGPLEIIKPKKVESLSILLFEKARGYINIDGDQYQVMSEMAIVLFPGQIVSCHFESGTIGQYLIAARDLYEIITSINNMPIDKSKLISIFKLNEDNFHALSQEFLEINKLLKKDDKGSAEIITNRFKTTYLILKAKCMHLRACDNNERRNPFIKKFVSLLDDFYQDEKLVVFYANAINISPSYLNKLCKKTFKVSTKQCIKNKILAEAKRLLLGTDLPIKEVSLNLGFRDAANFSNFFKKESGLYPRDFIQLRSKGIQH
ncbi:AraC family transcriptional regulator [Sphingobacterium sp. N143]|uniref:helix-turn-helix domain-containing protein n=1 Tax=Sphingobacterium sp. N143 TaxID=2746727 RepID=UPI0025777A20|nr:helix-turn-helix domain-containing protein [Sphingobacterium sp. N143]MDM1292720.1 AraC family transcriptional regulator [Sphingobacterium sp. N143]